MVGNETDEIIQDFFDSLLLKYQKSLEESMKGSEFVFDSVDLLHHKCYKITLNCSESYINSTKWVKNKRVTINPKNHGEKYFQYEVTVALKHQYIKYNPERITKIKPFKS